MLLGPLVAELGELLFAGAQKVLPQLHLEIDLSRLLLGRERRVHLLLLLGGGLDLFAGDVSLLKRRQEPQPVLGGQLGLLGELSLDHELLDVVDGVDVHHTVLDDASHLLKALERTHGTDGVTLYQDIAPGQKLKRFKCVTVGTN